MTLEQIKQAIKTASAASAPYAYVCIHGMEAIVKTASVSVEWLDCASLEDIRRISVF